MTATSFLVRHAKAGSRERWTRLDSERPLSEPGRRQAEGLVALLARAPIRLILSSPYVRCVQTVEPLAAARGLGLHHEERLSEGADPRWAIEALAAGGSVLCTHGDIVGAVVDWLHQQRLADEGGARWAKGSTWALDCEGDSIVAARYLPPPG